MVQGMVRNSTPDHKLVADVVAQLVTQWDGWNSLRAQRDALASAFLPHDLDLLPGDTYSLEGAIARFMEGVRMSWSVNIVGRPHAIKKALESHLDTLTGQSREEYEKALPNLVALVSLNEPSNALSKGAVEVIASGHANIRIHGDGTKTVDYSVCTVSIKALGSMVVE